MAVWESRVRDIPSVLRSAGRLLARHWPALLTIALLGAALRSAAIWTAVTMLCAWLVYRYFDGSNSN